MIFRRGFLYITIICTIIACNRIKGPKKPDNLISKEKMVDILIDARLISSASFINKKTMENNGIDLNTYVYTKHNIDSLQFALSNNYYAFHIKDYEEIYNKVEDSLEALKTKYKELEAQEWKEKTKREEDSLKAVISKQKDSLMLLKNKDSLNLVKEGALVAPISDTVSQ